MLNNYKKQYRMSCTLRQCTWTQL